MLTIYAIAPSLYCAKLRILLRHKQLAWEEVPPPGGYGSDQYKRLIASGNLPALVDGSLTLADSEAIAEYLNELHPDPAMLPGREFASFRGSMTRGSSLHCGCCLPISGLTSATPVCSGGSLMRCPRGWPSWTLCLQTASTPETH